MTEARSRRDRAIAEARVAVLLVTPDFLASEFVARVELPAILRRARTDLTVVWIPIRASAYEATPLSHFQAAHDPGRPLASLPTSKQDEVMVAISKQIAAAVNINALGNAFRIIDDFEPQQTAFMAGAPDARTSGVVLCLHGRRPPLMAGVGRTKTKSAEAMQPLFTLHAGDYLAGAHIAGRFKKTNVWVPTKDTGIDLFVSDRHNRATVSLQVKCSENFLVTHMRPQFQERLRACRWWTINQ